MDILNRRRVLLLGVGATSAGMTAASARDKPRAQNVEPDGLRGRRRPPERDHEPESEPDRRSRVKVRPSPSRVNAVAFWNEVSLALNVLDHSVEAANARAPGPCAATRAMALAHVAMADAVAAVYPVDFEGFFVRGPRLAGIEYPEAFVGGACAKVLEHIFNTPAHSHLLGVRRMQFLRALGGQGFEAWKAGLAFGSRREFIGRWDRKEIKYAAVNSANGYHPRPGKHDVDPFNPDQKFYGVKWGNLPPLVAEIRHSAVGPGDPPTEHDREFMYDAQEVRELGIFRPDGPSRDQERIGLFWAYDGARLIGTPNRLYNQIIRQILERDETPQPEMARTFALCNLAMADAGIVCWAAKYHYNVWRPVRALPTLFRDSGPWRPFGAPRTNPMQFSLGGDTRTRLTAISMMGGGYRAVSVAGDVNALQYADACFTPNFPSYPSGHATFASACFRLLQLIRSEDRGNPGGGGLLDGLPPIVSDELDGIAVDNFQNVPRPILPQTFRHIDEMIEANNRSRVYLGVHWNFDCDRGEESGARVAKVVYRSAYRRRRPAS